MGHRSEKQDHLPGGGCVFLSHLFKLREKKTGVSARLPWYIDTMQWTGLDWGIIAAVMGIVLGIGWWSGRKGKGQAEDYFLGGRAMPWWLLGTSMVATTFSADTPNLVTDLVRQQGVSGNWAWWAFLLTGMVTVFVYAKLWRRSGVLTDIEFYELRYGGRGGAFLRGFRAIYLGLVFNVLVMATVSLAAIKLGSILLGWPGWMTLAVTCSVTMFFSAWRFESHPFGPTCSSSSSPWAGPSPLASMWFGCQKSEGLNGLMTHPAVAGEAVRLAQF